MSEKRDPLQNRLDMIRATLAQDHKRTTKADLILIASELSLLVDTFSEGIAMYQDGARRDENATLSALDTVRMLARPQPFCGGCKRVVEYVDENEHLWNRGAK